VTNRFSRLFRLYPCWLGRISRWNSQFESVAPAKHDSTIGVLARGIVPFQGYVRRAHAMQPASSAANRTFVKR
jgi:hypothetical protein